MVITHRGSARLVALLVGGYQDVEAWQAAWVRRKRVPLVPAIEHRRHTFRQRALRVLHVSVAELLRRMTRELGAEEGLDIPGPVGQRAPAIGRVVFRVAARAMR